MKFVEADSHYNIFARVFILSLIFVRTNADDKIFSVISYGAKADGVTDDSEVFLKAWMDACKWNGEATYLIPLGTYMIYGANFNGPCKGSLIVKIQGVIKASTNPKIFCKGSWISFEYLNNLEIEGGGTLDGQGASAWGQSQCATRPYTIGLSSIQNAIVHDIHSINSKMFHFDIYNCNNVTLSHVNIIAPSDSPNTNGIHISLSSNIRVFDSNIGTGDDCISIFAGSQNVNISGVTCGPGHGISIGSLGNKPNEVVKDVHVKNCTLIATQNGMRIKSWASSNVGEATSISFEDIIMDKVNNPIIIDQHYCPSHTAKSLVQIKNVTFNNIRGTSNSLVAVYFNCSSSLPCQKINLNDIKLITDNNSKPTIASCANAIGHATGIELPPSCLKPALES
ncbi:exopolygalacturonase-like [Solanum stenotomum]|uniref:exopolygalacturonase-like n=1 Tax=Solanum stenotomum TaxID=172797 RepID=UPI0020D08F98|nr:exopolygalacturonase-like [Solanum stenotomum]